MAPPASTTVAEPSTTVTEPSTVPDTPAVPFPIATFAAISEDPVTGELADRFQTALEGLAVADGFTEGGGMTATVMTADGTWSGAVGTADGVRDLRVDDQFAIASITKSVVAAQVMQLVEAGELALDDPAAEHLPRDVQFDTNGATIRHLLSHRSGIPDDYEVMAGRLRGEPLRVWTPGEVLELIPPRRAPLGSFEYSGTNYTLLSLVIEQIRGRPLAEVLRDGVLSIDGVDRLVLQPDGQPSEPMAMPGGDSTAVLESWGGYLPSLAGVTAFTAPGALASDSPSLARWWRAFCAGEIVSQASLTEMSAFDSDDVVLLGGWYGLGLYNPALGHARGAVGHQGEFFGYMSWAACLPEEGAVMVVLTNRSFEWFTDELFYSTLKPFVDVLRSA